MEHESSQNELLDIWTESSSYMFDSAVAANKAAFAAFGLGADADNGTTPADIGPATDLEEWRAESTAETPADLDVGDRFQFSKTITDENIRQFAVASGDTNPLHLDEEYAKQTRFRGRIAHGTLVGGLISAALARMPGLVVYLSQDLEFYNPVRVDDRVTAECEIVEDLGDRQYRLTTRVVDDEQTIIDGEAVVLIDDEPE